MSKYTYLIDPGHGGIVNGKYVTPGKRSPKFEDGKVLFEGVNNRDNAKRLVKKLTDNGINAFDIVDSNLDISLTERVNKANRLNKEKPCIYISLHSDAAGDGVTWHQASGVSVYTSKGQTKSDAFATLVINSLQTALGNTVKWRTDSTDGDKDKEENFFVLSKTNCPSILCELGFHTNKAETLQMMTVEYKTKIVDAIYNAIVEWEKTN